jgi:hypothetical protein
VDFRSIIMLDYDSGDFGRLIVEAGDVIILKTALLCRKSSYRLDTLLVYLNLTFWLRR